MLLVLSVKCSIWRIKCLSFKSFGFVMKWSWLNLHRWFNSPNPKPSIKWQWQWQVESLLYKPLCSEVPPWWRLEMMIMMLIRAGLEPGTVPLVCVCVCWRFIFMVRSSIIIIVPGSCYVGLIIIIFLIIIWGWDGNLFGVQSAAGDVASAAKYWISVDHTDLLTVLIQDWRWTVKGDFFGSCVWLDY